MPYGRNTPASAATFVEVLRREHARVGVHVREHRAVDADRRVRARVVAIARRASCRAACPSPRASGPRTRARRCDRGCPSDRACGAVIFGALAHRERRDAAGASAAGGAARTRRTARRRRCSPRRRSRDCRRCVVDTNDEPFVAGRSQRRREPERRDQRASSPACRSRSRRRPTTVRARTGAAPSSPREAAYELVACRAQRRRLVPPRTSCVDRRAILREPRGIGHPPVAQPEVVAVLVRARVPPRGAAQRRAASNSVALRAAAAHDRMRRIDLRTECRRRASLRVGPRLFGIVRRPAGTQRILVVRIRPEPLEQLVVLRHAGRGRACTPSPGAVGTAIDAVAVAHLAADDHVVDADGDSARPRRT